MAFKIFNESSFYFHHQSDVNEKTKCERLWLATTKSKHHNGLSNSNNNNRQLCKKANIERFECEWDSYARTHLFVVYKYFRFDVMIRKIKNAAPNWIEWTCLGRSYARISSAKSNAIFKSWRFFLWLIPFPKWMLDLTMGKREVRLAIHFRPPHALMFSFARGKKYAHTFKRKVSQRTHCSFFFFFLFSLYLLMLIMLLHRLCEVEGTQRWT